MEHIFAIYIITIAIQRLRGPFQLFERLRGWLYEAKLPVSLKEEIQLGLNCPYCMSFWVALVIAILPRGLVKPLGYWGGAAILFQFVNKENI